MHLSLLSDSFLSDRLNDAGIRAEPYHPSAGRAHRDGVVRGLCFVAILAFPVLLTLGASIVDGATKAVSTGLHAASVLTHGMERRS